MGVLVTARAGARGFVVGYNRPLMDRAEIDATLLRLLAEASGRDPAATDLGASFEELGLDSVARVARSK